MQALSDASALGFGTRRWTGSADEARTLALALDRGCSLVDVTADPDPAGEVESTVGRVLSRRLDDVTVVTLCESLEPAAVVERVRVAAGRLRRDRVDVLLLDEPNRQVLGHAAAKAAVRAAFETCEALVDQGELGCYGVSSARLTATSGPGAALGLDQLLAIARGLRHDHRFTVVQVPCSVLTGRAASAPRGGLVHQARRDGLTTIGTGSMPVWPASGAAPLATCQTLLLNGVDHVLIEPSSEAHVRAVAPLLAGRIPAMRRAS